jgi:hypothetical protein
MSINLPPRTYQAVVVAKALKLYAKTGMKANRAYTPTNMLRTAGNITGKKYKRGQYMVAHDDLMAMLQS